MNYNWNQIKHAYILKNQICRLYMQVKLKNNNKNRNVEKLTSKILPRSQYDNWNSCAKFEIKWNFFSLCVWVCVYAFSRSLIILVVGVKQSVRMRVFEISMLFTVIPMARDGRNYKISNLERKMWAKVPKLITCYDIFMASTKTTNFLWNSSVQWTPYGLCLQLTANSYETL